MEKYAGNLHIPGHPRPSQGPVDPRCFSPKSCPQSCSRICWTLPEPRRVAGARESGLKLDRTRDPVGWNMLTKRSATPWSARWQKITENMGRSENCWHHFGMIENSKLFEWPATSRSWDIPPQGLSSGSSTYTWTKWRSPQNGISSAAEVIW